MSLALLTLSLLAAPPAQAQSGYPGGGGSGGGYPGGGNSGGGSGGSYPSGGGSWSITYSNKDGVTSYAVPDSPLRGLSAPQTYQWAPTCNGDGSESETYLNSKTTGSVTATLTWVPAAGQTIASDPPSKWVYIRETSTAVESPANWNGSGSAPTPAGSANDGLSDPQVPWSSGYISTGAHRVRKDGSSGTITLGPFTLTASCPVSSWVGDFEFIPEYPLLSYEYYYWDWMGGLCGTNFSVAVVPPAHPVNFRCINAYTEGDGILHYEYAWDSSTGNLADLDGCEVKERVSYEGNSTGYYSTDVHGTPCYVLPPPFGGVFADPEIYGDTPGTKGHEADDHLVGRIPGPYQPASFTTTQYYLYTDDTMDPNNPNDYVTLRGPIEIDRTVWAPDINWVYDVIKYDYPDAPSGSYLKARLILGPVYP